MTNRFCSFLILALICFSYPAHAWTEKALETADPLVFSPGNLSLDYFYLKTALKWTWVPGSFEWVRVDHRLLVPRARVRIQVPAQTPVYYQGRLSLSQGSEIELLVVLSQEPGNEIKINSEAITIAFKVQHPLDPPLIIDSTCASSPILFKDIKFAHSWGMVYCKPIHNSREHGYMSRMEVQFYWENENPKSQINANDWPVFSTDNLTGTLSLDSESPQIVVNRGGDSFTVEPHVAEVFHPLSVSMGLGPYYDQNTLRPFATFYGAYFLNEQMKVAAFAALPIKPSPEVDLGVYLITEQFKGLDERMSLNLLLGAHTLTFNSYGSQYFRFSAPQGVELSFRDFLMKTESILVGGFFYPSIDNRSYVNTWVRYGNAKLFFEFNYIHWQEPLANSNYESKSFGLSVGFPLFKAF